MFVLDSDTLQVILSPQAAGIPWFLHELEQDTEFSEWFAAEEIPRIAIEINEDISSPMFRLNLYHSTDSTYLAISIHHSLYDGIAFPLLMREVDAVYSNEDLSTPISLYVVVQQLNSCQRPERSKEFWVSQFEDANLVSRGLHRPSGKTTRSTKTLDISLQDLRARCGTMHTTLEALFASTFAHKGQALFGWSRDAVFGVSVPILHGYQFDTNIQVAHSLGQDEPKRRSRKGHMPPRLRCTTQDSSGAKEQYGVITILPESHCENHPS